MASIISAGTTSGTSLNLSGDTSGVLQLASNGSTTAVTINTSQNVGIGTTSPTQRLQLNVGGATDLYTRYTNGSFTNGFFVGLSSGNLALLAVNDNFPMQFQTNGTPRMNIAAAGQITTPVQPAFQIKGSSGSVAVANSAVLPFNTALTNVGSHFNTSTYTFTVPVTGVYFFAISLRWENTNGSAGYWRPDFYINGATSPTYTGAIQAIAANTYAYAAQSFVVSLNAGDTCKWHYNTNGNATNSFNMDESIFSGYLLG
jgi:hypothetical protein